MLKENVQHIISGLLATVMTLRLTACGSKAQAESQAAFTRRS